MNSALIKRLEKSEQAATALPVRSTAKADLCARLLQIGIELPPEETELAKTGNPDRQPGGPKFSKAELDARLRELGIEI
jgi:hypothetical protein